MQLCKTSPRVSVYQQETLKVVVDDLKYIFHLEILSSVCFVSILNVKTVW